MDQIRFDFLAGVNGSTGRNTNANAAETGDAFARILDQQLTRRADSSQLRRPDAPSRSDASDRVDNPRPQVLKRRDTKSPSTTASSKQDAATSKTAAKPKQPEKSENNPTTCAKPAAKSQADEIEQAAEAATGTPTAPENNASTAPTETDSKPDTSDNTPQQQGDGTQQQASDAPEQTDTVAADADLSLLAALAIPLPLQTLTASADASADAETLVSGGNTAAALQAGLAASLAGVVDLGAAAGGKAPAQAQANTAGLKFGAILKDSAAASQKNATDPLAALNAATEDPTAPADPLTEAAATTTAAAKPGDSGTSTKRDQAPANATATVTPDQNGKSPATVVQPVNRGAGVTWSGTNPRNELSESLAVSAESSVSADDAEFSNWSQVLGSNADGLSSSSLTARQSAFMAQLKQNLQILPPHEQIAVQIRDAMQNGNSRLTVALHPVELGRVEVKLDIDKDKNVTAAVIVDRPATLDLLRNDAKALERALQDAGLQTGSGSLSFSLRDSNGQNGGSAQNGTGTGSGSGNANGAGGSDAKAETVRPDVVAIADGYVDLET